MIILKYVFSIFLVFPIYCFDYNELEIFDLVEEINDNFYKVLEINKVNINVILNKTHNY